MAFNKKTQTALRDLIESQGEDGAVEVIREGIASKKLRADFFSIKEIWEACQTAAGLSTNLQEAVVSSAFPKITGEMINSRLISAYEEVPTIGSQLVTKVSSNVQMETIAGFTEAEGPDEVGENDEYKDSSIGEKYVTAHNVKFGRMISVTEEMIYFDKTGQVLEKARRIGMKCAQFQERMIVRGVMDLDSNIYRPSGVATAFFTAAGGNLVTSAPFGEAGLEAVRKAAQMMKDDAVVQNMSNFDYTLINLNNMIVLVPIDLEVEAWQMANSTLTPESGENAGNFFRQRFNPLTSPFVTHASSTTWYAGDPKMDFFYNEVWPLQVMSQQAGNDDAFKRDIKSRHKVRFYGSVAAVDNKHWFQCTA